MADSFNDIMSNYKDQSISELGTSLLNRQSQINAENAKASKKQQKITGALALMGVGQKIFKNAYNKRAKELDDAKIFELANNESQSKEIQTISTVLNTMPESWHEDKPIEERIDLFMESEHADSLGAQLRKPIDTVIEQASPYDFNTFKQNGPYYQQTFDNALRNIATDYLTDNKYKKYESELMTMLGQPDRVKALQEGMGLTPHLLSKAEKRYYDKIKTQYGNIGVVDSIKNVFSKIGNRQEEAGRINQFKNIEDADLYGSDFDDSIANLNLRTSLIKSVNKSFADLRKDPSRHSMDVRDPLNKGKVEQANNALDTFSTRMKTRSIAKKDIFMNISLGTKPGAMLRNRGSMYARYLDDLVPGERQEMVQDIAEVSELFLDDKELAVDIYKSQLDEIGEEYDDNKLQIFKAKLDDDTERLNFSIAIVSREGFVSSGILPRETYDSTGIIGTKIVDKYSYDRFQGEIPALIGEGISTPAESKGKGFQVDKNWGKLKPDAQREMFDLHYNAIQKGKASESAKQLLTENLFSNIPHPDKYNYQEYVQSRLSSRTEKLGLGIAKGLFNPQNKPVAIAQQIIGALGEKARPKINNQIEKVTDLKANESTDSELLEKEKEKLFKMQIKDSDDLIVQQLLSDEGYRTNVYKDSEGYLTVGIGHKLTDEEKEIYKEGDYVPTDVVKEFTENDINKFINITNEVMENKGLLDSKLYKENEDMFVSFFYQLGKDGGLGFNNMWDAIDKGDAQGAYDAALDSKWAKQTPNRAKRFAKMLKKEVK